MADVIGTIAACDQLIGSFSSACKQLSKAYKIIKYAQKDIRQVKKRTKRIRELWCFFKQTMEDVFRIEEFSVDLREYKAFYRDIIKHAQNIEGKILDILEILNPILKRRTVSLWTNLQTRWRWFMQAREALRPLYEEMNLLTALMAFFMNLVQLQIAAKLYMLQKSAATKVQVDCLERTLNAQLKELECIVKAQRANLTEMINKDKVNLLQEIRRVTREEIKRIPRPGAADDSSDPSPPPSPPPRAPPTPPTDPDSPGNSRVVSESPSKELNPRPNRLVLPTPSPATAPTSYPVHVLSNSEASYVSINEAFPQNQPTVANPSQGSIQLQLRADDGSENRSEPGGIYVPTALFGPPKKQHRPRAGRISNEPLTPTSSQDDPRGKKPIDHNKRHAPENTVLDPPYGPSSRNDEGAPQDQDGSRLAPRRNGVGTRATRVSGQQTYGADGLVLPSHIIPTPENVKAWLRTQ